MSPRKRSPKIKFSLEDKLSAINRVCVNGETKASVARDINAPESTLRGWCKARQKIIAQLNMRCNPTCHQACRTSSESSDENMMRFPLSPIINGLRLPQFHVHQDARADEDFEAGEQQLRIKENLIAEAEATATVEATSSAEATAEATAAVAAITSIINRIYPLPLTSRNNSDMIEGVHEANREDRLSLPPNFFEILVMCTQFNQLLYTYGDLISSSNERAIINKFVEDLRKWYMNNQKLRKKSQ